MSNAHGNTSEQSTQPLTTNHNNMLYIVEVSRFIRTSETEQIRQDERKHFSNHMIAVNYATDKVIEYRKDAEADELLNKQTYPRNARVWVRIIQSEIDKPDYMDKEVWCVAINYRTK